MNFLKIVIFYFFIPLYSTCVFSNTGLKMKDFTEIFQIVNDDNKDFDVAFFRGGVYEEGFFSYAKLYGSPIKYAKDERFCTSLVYEMTKTEKWSFVKNYYYSFNEKGESEFCNDKLYDYVRVSLEFDDLDVFKKIFFYKINIKANSEKEISAVDGFRLSQIDKYVHDRTVLKSTRLMNLFKDRKYVAFYHFGDCILMEHFDKNGEALNSFSSSIESCENLTKSKQGHPLNGG